MLVTRRRGCGGGRGGAGGFRKPELREAYVNSSTPEGEVTNATAARTEVVRLPRGGMARGRGGYASSQPLSSEVHCINTSFVTSDKTLHNAQNTFSTAPNPIVALEVDSGGLSASFPGSKAALTSKGKEKNL